MARSVSQVDQVAAIARANRWHKSAAIRAMLRAFPAMGNSEIVRNLNRHEMDISPGLVSVVKHEQKKLGLLRPARQEQRQDLAEAQRHLAEVEQQLAQLRQRPAVVQPTEAQPEVPTNEWFVGALQGNRPHYQKAIALIQRTKSIAEAKAILELLGEAGPLVEALDELEAMLIALADSGLTLAEIVGKVGGASGGGAVASGGAEAGEAPEVLALARSWGSPE